MTAAMDRNRWFAMAEILSAARAETAAPDTLCTRCQGILSVTGAGISLMSETSLTSLCASDDRMATLEDLQFTLGEGPSIEAFDSGQPVLESQLTAALAVRWPVLASLVIDAGVEGVFAFPLRVGAARIGTLTLYQQLAVGHSSDQHADALIAADALAHVILSLQANAPEGALAAGLQDAGTFRAEIHQASGMLSEQLHVSVAAALVLLRSRAYATDLPIADLATAVVARRLRLTRSEDRQIEWSADE